MHFRHYRFQLGPTFARTPFDHLSEESHINCPLRARTHYGI